MRGPFQLSARRRRLDDNDVTTILAFAEMGWRMPGSRMATQTENAITAAFDDLDDSLKLDPDERNAAQERHTAVRDCLRNAGLTTGGFLQGSFARATMLKPLKDVDTVNMVAPAWQQVAEAPGGVQKLFDEFQAAVLAEWPSARFDVEKVAGKALAVTFSDCEFTVDLCAALPTGSDDVVLLGNRDQDADEQWQRSLTKRLNARIAARNQDTGGVFVHEVRVLKTLKHLHDDLDDVDGIVFESVAYWSITEKLPFAQAIARALRSGADLLEGQMPDPTNEGDLTASWSPRKRATVVRAFERLATTAEAGIEAAYNDDQESAFTSWRAVVGSDFGDEVADAATALSQWSIGGRDTSRWGAEHGDRRLAPAPGRSWQSR